jgi:hypothetical protein
MGISILSYAGNAMVGIMTDACLVSDPMTIAENFNVELRAMQAWLQPAAAAVEEASASGVASEPGAPVVAAEPPAPEARAEVRQEVAEDGVAPDSVTVAEVAGAIGAVAPPRKPRKRKTSAPPEQTPAA